MFQISIPKAVREEQHWEAGQVIAHAQKCVVVPQDTTIALRRPVAQARTTSTIPGAERRAPGLRAPGHCKNRPPFDPGTTGADSSDRTYLDAKMHHE